MEEEEECVDRASINRLTLLWQQRTDRQKREGECISLYTQYPTATTRILHTRSVWRALSLSPFYYDRSTINVSPLLLLLLLNLNILLALDQLLYIYTRVCGYNVRTHTIRFEGRCSLREEIDTQ